MPGFCGLFRDRQRKLLLWVQQKPGFEQPIQVVYNNGFHYSYCPVANKTNVQAISE
jgi:hypothetical protein